MTAVVNNIQYNCT